MPGVILAEYLGAVIHIKTGMVNTLHLEYLLEFFHDNVLIIPHGYSTLFVPQSRAGGGGGRGGGGAGAAGGGGGGGARVWWGVLWLVGCCVRGGRGRGGEGGERWW